MTCATSARRCCGENRERGNVDERTDGKAARRGWASSSAHRCPSYPLLRCRLRERVGPNGFVFTSGGIGPTHDDKSYGRFAERQLCTPLVYGLFAACEAVVSRACAMRPNFLPPPCLPPPSIRGHRRRLRLPLGAARAHPAAHAGALRRPGERCGARLAPAPCQSVLQGSLSTVLCVPRWPAAAACTCCRAPQPAANGPQGLELNEARLRMALLPCDDQVEVLFTPGLWVPLVNCHGVYILPGIPR